MQQNNYKDPAIRLFGKKIPLNSDAELPPISVVDLPDSDRAVEQENEVKTDKENSSAKITETTQQEVDDCCPSQDTGESADQETVGDGNVNPKTPSIDEESARSKTSNIDKEQNDGTNTQGKTLKKPEKVLPCPRCHSMDTKFCYYNNYNTNQPRHLCKACQRYWTAGGIMRNVPVGSGRRKNKNSTAHYRHIAISDALQAVPNGSPGLKANGRILSFGLDMPICDSMAAVMSVADRQARNGVRNGFHGPCKGGENGSDDCSSGSSVTISNSAEECGHQGCASEPLMPSVNGFASPIPCLPGVPWQYPWNSVLPLPPAFCPPPSGFPMSFSPPFWNYSIAPGTWKIPLLSPQSSSSNRQAPSNHVSPTLGKHSRDQETLKQHDLEEKELSGKNKNRCVLVPKILRIDDPDEAAKSSIWATLGIKNEFFSGKLFKPLQSKNDEKNHQVPETCPVLTANPAALSRSINFHEST